MRKRKTEAAPMTAAPILDTETYLSQIEFREDDFEFMHPKAPEVEMPIELKERIKRMMEEAAL